MTVGASWPLGGPLFLGAFPLRVTPGLQKTLQVKGVVGFVQKAASYMFPVDAAHSSLHVRRR